MLGVSFPLFKHRTAIPFLSCLRAAHPRLKLRKAVQEESYSLMPYIVFDNVLVSDSHDVSFCPTEPWLIPPVSERNESNIPILPPIVLLK
jgi:hypothetical protein